MYKYFTPTIEDIKIGYECEYFENQSKEWIKYVFDCNKIEEHINMPEEYIKNNFRNSYLTKDQIEEKGWLVDYSDESDISASIYSNELNWYLEYWIDHFSLKITASKPGDSNDITFFLGSCKDINTFNHICKLIGQ